MLIHFSVSLRVMSIKSHYIILNFPLKIYNDFVEKNDELLYSQQRAEVSLCYIIFKNNSVKEFHYIRFAFLGLVNIYFSLEVLSFICGSLSL